MEIKVNRFIKYSIEPKIEKFEIALIVISNWKNSEELIEFAINKNGYCDSNNGFGIGYKDDIDYETKSKVPKNHILITAEAINKNEFIISELEYLKILSQFFYSKNEDDNARIVENLIEIPKIENDKLDNFSIIRKIDFSEYFGKIEFIENNINQPSYQLYKNDFSIKYNCPNCKTYNFDINLKKRIDSNRLGRKLPLNEIERVKGLGYTYKIYTCFNCKSKYYFGFGYHEKQPGMDIEFIHNIIKIDNNYLQHRV